MKSKYFILTTCAISVLLLLFSFAGYIQAQVVCITDEDCNDGLFCTGTEICIDGSCTAVSACPPAIDGCVTRGAFCDEDNDLCVDFADDSQCDAGQICDVITGDCTQITCGMAQFITQEVVTSGGPYRNHGQMVKTAAHAANPYLYEGVISQECHSCIVSQFARRIPIEEQQSCE
jgi:hypothetical protein